MPSLSNGQHVILSEFGHRDFFSLQPEASERLLSSFYDAGVAPARFVAQGHFGLAGVRERAAMIGGKLDVQTANDYGTVVILELPR